MRRTAWLALAFMFTVPAVAEERLDDSVRQQIEANWNVGTRAEECADRKFDMIEVRITLDPYGTVTKVEPLNLKEGDRCASTEYEKAKRAILISSPLRLPKDVVYETMRLRFYPDEVLQ